MSSVGRRWHTSARVPKNSGNDKFKYFQAPADYGHIRLDLAGRIYLSIWIIWTLVVGLGVWQLWRNRRESYIRFRNIPLVLSAMFFIHAMLSWDLLTYVLNGVLPCDIEYWFMNFCLP
jgi:hypothetical protein